MFVLALLAFVAWLYLLVFHGRFWGSGPVVRDGLPSGRASVVAIVPARDEAESIAQSLSSLLAQDYPGEFNIILVDDNSTDGTGAIAASLDNERLTILAGAPLPAGWSGKLWALHQGLEHPRAHNADYVLFTDADIVHAPNHITLLVAKAETSGCELVSEMVRLNCQTRAERALIPAFVFFFQMLYPFAWVADPKRKTAGAAGGTMLVARAALGRIEGAAHIRDRLIDDCALAQEIKRTGGHIWLGHSECARSLRVYRDAGEVADTIARTAYVQLGRSPLLLLGCMAGMAILYLAPPLLAIAAHGPARLLGAAAWLMMAGSFQPTLRRYQRSPLWGVALPAIAMFYMGATFLSALRHYAGRGGGWKNRVYHRDQPPDAD